MRNREPRVHSSVAHRTVASFILLFSFAALVTPASTQSQALSTGWEFLPDPSAQITSSTAVQASGWRPVTVGQSWNAQFDDLRDYMGVAWYRTSFSIPADLKDQHVLLRFGAVDYLAEIFVNGKKLGQHEGGYTPFVIDASQAVHSGNNQLLVRVFDPPMKGNNSPFKYDEIPHGKQNWYVQTGGIWQPVVLDIRPPEYIEKVHVTPSLDGVVEVNVDGPSGAEVSLTITDPTGRTAIETSDRLGTAPISRRIKDPLLWTPSSPNLYTLTASLANGDSVTTRFGFRSFEAKNGKLFLNGEPFYMIAALDQDFYPDTIYTPPSKQYIVDEMKKGKALGLNLLRCHIKVCDPQYLDAADETGMLVWYEIPSWNDENHFTPEAAQRGEKTFADMVDRDWNHPSIVIQSIINESWGVDLKDPAQREWLKQAYKRAKQLTAPLGRVIDDNSACCHNFHVASDLDDFHQYYSMPDNRAKWDAWVKDFSSRPAWSFSTFDDAERTNHEPLIVSEFGNWGLPQLPANLPWWFSRDFGGREVTRPAGVLERFRDYKFARVFPDYNRLAEATQWHQFESLKHEIEEMRRYGSIQGYVITEFTDINWESNGLMDMWRNPKAYAAQLSTIQQPDLVMAFLPRQNYWPGEQIDLEVVGSHYSSLTWSNLSASLAIDGALVDRFEIASLPKGEARSFGHRSLSLPSSLQSGTHRLTVELRDSDSRPLASNTYDFWLYSRPPQLSAVRIHDPSGSLPSLRNIPSSADAKIMIASIWDTTVEQHLSNGGSAVIIANTTRALPANFALKLTTRDGSDLDGNWVTNFNWRIPNSALFNGLPSKPIMGFEAAAVTPRYILQNLKPDSYNDVLAGIFYGWLNKNAALLVQVKVGTGKALITTFDFSKYSTDPYATTLMTNMISYLNGNEMAPQLEIAPTQLPTASGPTKQ